MSINVGELQIGLKADVARLQADMTAAKTSVQGAMKDIEQYVGYAKTAFLGLGGVLAVGAFKGAIEGAIEAKAKLYDLSLQTGINVEALSALGKVAKFSNTSLDDVAGASNKLSKALQTQNEDSKGAAQAVASLGLNFDKLKQLSPDQQMLAIAKAMDGFQDGAGKSAAAMLLFGKTGATLLPFMKELAEKTTLVGTQTSESARQAKEYEDNLKKLSAAGDEWKRDIATSILPGLNDIIGTFIKARKEVGLLEGAFLTFGAGVDKALGGKFGELGRTADSQATEMAQLTANVEKYQKAVNSGGFGAFVAGGLLTSGKQLLAEKTREHAETLRQLAIAEDETRFAGRMPTISGNAGKPQIAGLGGGGRAGASPQASGDFDKALKQADEMLARMREEEELGRQLTDAERLKIRVDSDYANGQSKLGLMQKLLVDDVLDEAIARQKLAKARETDRSETLAAIDADFRQLIALKDESAALKSQFELYGKTSEELQALTVARLRDAAAAKLAQAAEMDDNEALGVKKQLLIDQAKQLQDIATTKELIAAKEARDRDDPTAGAARAVKEYLSDVKRAGDATYGAVHNAIHSLEDATASILSGGNAKQAARGWANGIIAEVQRLYVVKPLIASLFGSSGGGSGAGLFGSLLGAFSSFFGGTGYTVDTSGAGIAPGGYTGVAGTSGGRASGGPVGAGRSYLVGEQGPEILRMGSQGGSIVPNNAIGGGNVSVVIHNNGSNTKATAREERGADGARQIRVLIEDVVVNGVQSGGPIHQALSGTYGLNRASGAPRY